MIFVIPHFTNEKHNEVKKFAKVVIYMLESNCQHLLVSPLSPYEIYRGQK
jgi:hypothetical protein